MASASARMSFTFDQKKSPKHRTLLESQAFRQKNNQVEFSSSIDMFSGSKQTTARISHFSPIASPRNNAALQLKSEESQPSYDPRQHSRVLVYPNGIKRLRKLGKLSTARERTVNNSFDQSISSSKMSSLNTGAESERSKLLEHSTLKWMRQHCAKTAQRTYLNTPVQLQRDDRIEKIFQAFDGDKSGTLEVSELYSKFKEARFKISREELKQLFQVVSQKGMLSLDQFRAFQVNEAANRAFKQKMEKVRRDSTDTGATQKYLPRTFSDLIKYFIFSENRASMLRELEKTEGTFSNVGKDLENFHKLLKLTQNVQKGVVIEPGSQSFKIVYGMLTRAEKSALKQQEASSPVSQRIFTKSRLGNNESEVSLQKRKLILQGEHFERSGSEKRRVDAEEFHTEMIETRLHINQLIAHAKEEAQNDIEQAWGEYKKNMNTRKDQKGDRSLNQSMNGHLLPRSLRNLSKSSRMKITSLLSQETTHNGSMPYSLEHSRHPSQGKRVIGGPTSPPVLLNNLIPKSQKMSPRSHQYNNPIIPSQEIIEVIRGNVEKEQKPCFFKYVSPQQEERKKLQKIVQKPPMSAPTGEISVKSQNQTQKLEKQKSFETKNTRSKRSILSKTSPRDSQGILTTVNMSVQNLESDWKVPAVKPLVSKSLLYKVQSQRMNKLATCTTTTNTVASLKQTLSKNNSSSHRILSQSSTTSSNSTMFEIKGASLNLHGEGAAAFTFGKFPAREPNNQLRVQKQKRRMQKALAQKKPKLTPVPQFCDRSISMMQNSVCGGDSVHTLQSDKQLNHQMTVHLTKRDKLPEVKESEMLISDQTETVFQRRNNDSTSPYLMGQSQTSSAAALSQHHP